MKIVVDKTSEPLGDKFDATHFGGQTLSIVLSILIAGLGVFACVSIWGLQDISLAARGGLVVVYASLAILALWSIWHFRTLTNIARISVPIFFLQLAMWANFLVSFNYTVGNSDIGILLTNAVKSVGPELAGIVIGVVIIDYLNERRQDEQLKIQLIRNMASHNNSIADTAIRELADRGWLQDGSLIGKRFRGANWQESNLRDADLREADLTGACLKGAVLNGAKLDKAQMVGSCLQASLVCYASLEGCRLNGAKLSESDFRGSVLRDATLMTADLSRANLTSTDLRDADLYQAILKDVVPGRSLTLPQLESAKRLEGAVMPDGTKLRDIDGDVAEPTLDDWLKLQNPEDWSPMKRSIGR